MSELRIAINSILHGLVSRGVRLGEKPSRFLWAALIVRDLMRLRKPNFTAIRRFISVNCIKAITLDAKSNLPSIEGLVVSTRKDFEVLALCIPSIVESSFNKITKITIIVPNSDLEECQILIANLKMLTPIEIIDEDMYLSHDLRSRIRNLFGNRYGWVLQQLLTVEFVRRSQARGVLVVNSDTILLKKMVWLEETNRQILMPSWEFNDPYYKFLESLSVYFVGITQSFISHHMLMQPSMFRQILSRIGIDSIEALLQKVETHGDLSSNSPICLEFEIYAQGLLAFSRDQAVITKWSNIGLSRKNTSSPLKEIARLKRKGYFRSVSIHSWS
jgi:hypothetical protein